MRFIPVHDGPMSVLRSYTVPELEGFAERAGPAGRRVVKEPFWQIVVSGRKGYCEEIQLVGRDQF
jgi:hypothetical protein